MPDTLAKQIDAILPQTQCRKCGYQGCWPYAQAISQGRADINRCPPGGASGISRLADLLGVSVIPLDPSCGEERPRQIAVIDEAVCIGCTKCIPPCPVDAILGAAKQMHSIISQLCTGCELCIDPCPVNCISLQPAVNPDWQPADADWARTRYYARNQRLSRLEDEKKQRLAKQKLQLTTLKPLKAGQ
ncbi:RnfABCDGE type electron transport complex subunit B [Methylomonas paludis]|uniref:RnfABCDGE type electron transport complex subunit B n=1 Tax=Methylomonas paludis TaxID=1173101 RepID=A0A975MMP5_9GAMM|nr:RnfABCDGE type electron transport complex subunit B [Methylomonas paludis]QWF70617.1 RnfABCDGE type electron transport complex subunit B [Methylomonas paludis]